MGFKCTSLSSKELETIKKNFNASIQNNEQFERTANSAIKRIKEMTSIGNLNDAEIITTTSLILTENPGMSIETLLSPSNADILNRGIAAQRNKKSEELEAFNNPMIGNAAVKVLKPTTRITKEMVRSQPRTLFVISENIQAYNIVAKALGRTPITVSGVEEITDKEQQKTLTHITSSNTQAVMRTNTNGDFNPNVIGLPVKPTAFKNGKFTNEDEDQFQESQEEEFIAAINQFCDEVLKLLSTEDFDKIVFPAEFASSLARLRKPLADKMVEILNNKLGIQSQAIRIFPKGNQNWKGEWYKIEISQKQVNKKSSNKSGSNSNTKNKEQKEALKSLEAERPILSADIAEIKEEDMNILSKVLPNIEERKARVDFINTLFSANLTSIINYYKAELAKMSPEEKAARGFDYLERGLTKGSVAQQRIFALTNIEQDGLSLTNYIFKSIKDTMNTIVTLMENPDAIFNPNDPKENQITNIEFVVNNIILRTTTDADGNSVPDGLLAIEFDNQAYDYGWNKKQKVQHAYQRARILANAFKVMLDEKVFNALLKDVAFDLLFNESIRLDFSGIPTQTREEEDDEDLNEGNIDANKEGYMIKYKLLNPGKTLSVRMKSAFANLYLTRANPDGSWSYVYDDLGQRIRMNPSLAYYTLLEEFSEMTKPEDLDDIMEDAVNTYPWLNSIYDKVVLNPYNANEYDPNFRKEFFTTFRKSAIPYGMTTFDGTFTRLNMDAKSETFLHEITKAYEGREVLGDNSIYNADGQCNESNVKKLANLVNFSAKYITAGNKTKKVTKTNEELKKDHPIAWAYDILTNKNSKHRTSKNIIDAIKLLQGLDKDHPKISLEAMLNNLGVNTANINLGGILPDVSELSEEDSLDTVLNTVTDKQISKISAIIEAARVITNQSEGETGGFHKGDDLVAKFQSSYLSIGNALSMVSEAYTLATFRAPDGTDRFTYAAPDFISDFVNSVTSEDRESGNEYLEHNYGRFEFFRDKETGEWNNTLLGMLFNPNPQTGKYNVRDNFEYINMLAFGGNKDANSIGQADKHTMLQGFINMYYSANNDSDDNTYGWYTGPLISDVDACVMYKLPRFTGAGYQQQLITLIAKVLEQEIDRINAVDSGDNNLQIEFYNDNKSNARKFQFFPELNARREEILSTLGDMASDNAKEYAEKKQEYLESIIAELMQEKVARFLNEFSEEEKGALWASITKIAKKKQRDEEKLAEIEGREPKTIEELFEEESIPNSEKIETVNEKLEEFYYNNFFMHSQLIQVLGGDLAYYKNFRDFIKRFKQAYACGERLYARDEDGNTIVEHCMYSEDLHMVSNSWSSINKLLSADKTMTSLEKSILRGAINAFKNINSTDGQSFRTMKSFKKIFEARGVWTDAMEDAYNHIREGKFTSDDFLTLWHPIKPFVFSYEAKMINGRLEKVPVQHKNSEYMLNAIYSMLNVAMNKSPELQAIHQFMEDNDIDVLHFHSVVKEGFFGAVDINHDEKAFKEDFPNKSYKEYLEQQLEALKTGKISQEQYNESISKYRFKNKEAAYKALQEQMGAKDNKGNIIKGEGNAIKLNEDMDHVIPLDDYLIVQPSDDHLVDHEALFGSQLRNIIPADLPDDFTLTINGQTLNREEAVQYYNTIIADQLLDSFSKVDREFSDIEKLQKALLAKMENNPKYGPDVKQALELNEDKTAFKMPFNSPNLTNKIEELILSTFKNAIQKQTIDGGNVVLVSNYGLSDELHVQWKNAKTGKLITSKKELENTPKEDLAVDHIPCYLPYTKKDMLKDFLVEQPDGTFILDFKKMESVLGDESKKLLEIIGYRIPTEDKYSAMPLRIYGFMPSISGTTIMLPSDIITMSGTDFDIDKLFIMIRSIRRETHRAELRQAFLQWLNKNNPSGDESSAELLKGLLLKQLSEETDNKEIEEIKKTIEELESSKNINLPEVRKLLRSNKGLTEQEIASMEEQSELFSKFMEEEGFNYAYKNPKYIIKKPRKFYKDGKLDLNMMSKKASKDERNNMLIDVIWGVLTSPAGSRLSMMPGSYNNVSHGSRQQRILHDSNALQKFLSDTKIQKKLQDITGNKDYKVTTENLWKSLNLLSTDDLDAFYEENATIQNPMDILDYVDNHRNLMDGNDLIGRFAVNSSNHYKFQFLNLKIKPQYRFKINGIEIKSIDSVDSPITGVKIGRMCAEFQAASPDNGKDPTLGDLGANRKTVSRISFLLRIGLDAQSIGIINTSDKLVSLGKTLSKMSTLGLKGTKINNFDLNFDKITQYLADYTLLGEEGFLNKYSTDDLQYIKDYAVWFDTIKDLSSELSSASIISRSDSTNGALSISIAETAQQRLKAEDFIKLTRSQNKMIDGLEELIDIDLDATSTSKEELRNKILESKIPRLQAFYTLGHKSARSLSKKWLVQMNDNVFNLVKLLRDVTKDPLTYNSDIPLLKKFYSELTMYMMSYDSIFSTDTSGRTLMEKRNYYLHDFPMKLKQYLEEKDSNNEYKHKEIKNLNFIKRLSNSNKKGIKFKNVNKITPQSRKHYVEELESLLNIGPEEAELAMDLFMYAYYDSGLSFRHNSFGIFFTTAFMRAIPRYVNKLQEANNRLQSDSQFAVNFVYQFMLNHPDIIPKIRSNDYTKVDNNTIRILRQEDGFFPNGIMSGIDSLGEPLKIVKVGTDIYVLEEGNTQTSLIYTKMTERVPNDTLFYDASKSFEEIEYNKLQGRGYITNIPKKDKNKDSMNKKNIKNSEVPNDKNVSNSEAPKENVSSSDVPKEDILSVPTEDTLGEDIIDSEVPKDNTPNDDEIAQQADAMDAVEYTLKKLAEDVERAQAAVSNMANLNQNVPVEKKNEKDISNFDDGPTNLCVPKD